MELEHHVALGQIEYDLYWYGGLILFHVRSRWQASLSQRYVRRSDHDVLTGTETSVLKVHFP